MSQVVKAIVEHDTGNRKLIEGSFSPLFQDVFRVKTEISETHLDAEVAKIYRIGITLGAQVMVTDTEQRADEDALRQAVDRTKRHVIEAIFGEFRTDFMSIEQALYDRNFQKARDRLRVFENKMFNTL